MQTFTDWILILDRMGVLDILLPFLLIFTIAFAVLQKSMILGPNSKKFNTIVAFVIGMASVMPHIVGRGPDVVPIINSALPNVSVLMIASMMVLLMIGVFGNNVNVAGTPLVGIVVLFSAISVGYTFIAAAGGLPMIPFLNDPETLQLLVAILVFGIIVWFITKEENVPQHKKTFKEHLNDWFGGMYGGGSQGGHH
ncbi:MAG: hypothetical protein QXE31_03625 [Candidatus Woesearchaeota archaeon]